ncbi:MAG: HPP family protein [Chloroflexi bacterium]|nr:HPP family protein [Chloroflexota bacterium]
MPPVLSSYLRRRWNRIRKNFRSLWKHYLYQTCLATLVLAVVLWLLSAENAVIVASIGATAFLVFSMPRIATAQPRRIIGGQLIGLLAGSLLALVPHPAAVLAAVIYSLAVGLSMFLMIALDLAHPPAAGTALGVAISGFSLPVMLAVITSSLALAAAHRYLYREFRNLI